jgi:hypothetical protein
MSRKSRSGAGPALSEDEVLSVLSAEERKLWDLLGDPAEWGETMLTNRDGTPRVFRDYQLEDLQCDAPRIVHMDGRAVGKTVDLGTLVLWFAFRHPGKSVLVAAPFQGHLDVITDEVEHQLGANEILRESVARNTQGQPKIKRKPYYEIDFTNGSKAYFRPAGSAGNAFRSLHVDLLLVDEGAWIPELAWKALRQCLNADGKFRVYSTPNGLRDTTYYRITQSKEWKQFRWPSWVAPDWSEEREKDLVEFYGGKDTPGWQHEVAGEHGKPAYGAFNTVQVIRSLDDIEGYRKVAIFGADLEACADEQAIRDRLEQMLNLAGGQGVYWLGGDLGYTSDPTELLLFEEDLESGRMTLLLRVHAENIPYPVITEVIALIDRVYTCAGIGVDRGGNGMSVVQELLGLDKYRDLHLAGRLLGYDFGSTLAVGEDAAGNPVKKRIKEHMTALINESLNSRRLVLPKQDHQVEDQLCTQTYVLSERGVVYSKGNDHIVDALRCAVLRRSQERDPIYEGGAEIEAIAFPARLTRALP